MICTVYSVFMYLYIGVLIDIVNVGLLIVMLIFLLVLLTK